MATAYVTYGYVGARSELRDDVMVFNGANCRSETITTSGAAATGSLTAEEDQVIKIFCDTALYAKTGLAPVADSTTGLFIEANVREYVAVKKGDTLSLINA